MNDNLEKLKYPIGKFAYPGAISDSLLQGYITVIRELPGKLRSAARNLSDQQLDTPYRENGWTLRQVIHHLPDSHLNAYLRFKLAVTEDNPTIRPYHEDRWAECAEAKQGDIGMSLDLLEGLHKRWAAFLLTLIPPDFERTYYHPESEKLFKLYNVLAMYAWHGEHHLAHITETRKSKGW